MVDTPTNSNTMENNPTVTNINHTLPTHEPRVIEQKPEKKNDMLDYTISSNARVINKIPKGRYGYIEDYDLIRAEKHLSKRKIDIKYDPNTVYGMPSSGSNITQRKKKIDENDSEKNKEIESVKDIGKKQKKESGFDEKMLHEPYDIVKESPEYEEESPKNQSIDDKIEKTKSKKKNIKEKKKNNDNNNKNYSKNQNKDDNISEYIEKEESSAQKMKKRTIKKEENEGENEDYSFEKSIKRSKRNKNEEGDQGETEQPEQSKSFKKLKKKHVQIEETPKKESKNKNFDLLFSDNNNNTIPGTSTNKNYSLLDNNTSQLNNTDLGPNQNDIFSCSNCEPVYRLSIMHNIPLKVLKCLVCGNIINNTSLSFYLEKYKIELLNKSKKSRAADEEGINEAWGNWVNINKKKIKEDYIYNVLDGKIPKNKNQKEMLFRESMNTPYEEIFKLKKGKTGFSTNKTTANKSEDTYIEVEGKVKRRAKLEDFKKKLEDDVKKTEL